MRAEGEPRLRQGSLGLANLHPVEGGIVIHRIVQPVLAARCEPGAQVVAAKGQQRAADQRGFRTLLFWKRGPARARRRAWRKARPARCPRASRSRKVSAWSSFRMADEQGRDPVLHQPGAHQPVSAPRAPRPRCRLSAWRRARSEHALSGRPVSPRRRPAWRPWQPLCEVRDPRSARMGAGSPCAWGVILQQVASRRGCRRHRYTANGPNRAFMVPHRFPRKHFLSFALRLRLRAGRAYLLQAVFLRLAAGGERLRRGVGGIST